MYCSQLQNMLKQKIDCLYDSLAASKIKTSSLIYRISNIRSESEPGCDIDSKFLIMLSKLEKHRFDEYKLIEEIESIEKKHADLKKQDMLWTAENEKAFYEYAWNNEEDKKKKNETIGLTALLIWWFLFKNKRAYVI